MQALIRHLVPHLCAAALLAFVLQPVGRANAQGIAGYTYLQDDGTLMLALPDGRYPVYLGYGCDGMNVTQNVDVVFGSGGVATLSPTGVDALCDVYVDAPVSDVPCVADASGVCNIDDESN
jgi:hypothetical protein